jgi:hypothetical protein
VVHRQGFRGRAAPKPAHLSARCAPQRRRRRVFCRAAGNGEPRLHAHPVRLQLGCQREQGRRRVHDPLAEKRVPVA